MTPLITKTTDMNWTILTDLVARLRLSDIAAEVRFGPEGVTITVVLPWIAETVPVVKEAGR